MCLTNYSSEETRKLRRRKTPIICWKVVSLCSESLYRIHTYKSGINYSGRSTRKRPKEEIRAREVYTGFHVFKTKYAAQKEATYWEDNFRSVKIIKCVGQPSDLVGVGKFQRFVSMVFTKMDVEL